MLRELEKRELKILKKALKAMKKDKLDFALKIKENERKNVIALNEELLNFIKENKELNYVFAGIKVGEIGKRFRLTLEGAFFICESCGKRVYVNDKGEMLFLYGRDIFSESVLYCTDDVGENDVVLVCNSHGDVIGIGKSRFDHSRIKKVGRGRVVVENLVDRGEYLRKRKLYDAF